MRLYAAVFRAIVDATIFHYLNLSLFFGAKGCEVASEEGRKGDGKNPE